MASSSRIKGITIEIDGSTTGLQKSLESVTKESINIQKELKDVERLLKFDPGNTEALAQKQKLLAAQIEATSSKLNKLKEAEQQVEKQFQSGDIGEAQYRSFRREIEFTETELGKLKQSIAKVDDGSAIKNIKQDLSKIPEEANKAQGSVKDLGGELTNLVAGAAAGVGIGKIVEEAFDVSSLNTKIAISFNVPEESIQSVKNAISTVETYGVDAEAALEGIRRQWALNKNASDESNSAVVTGAATIVAAYGDVDFTELIQETNELSKTLGISDEDAIALTYSLLKMGFPPDQVDIISEYGTQLKMAGFNAQEIQAIMKTGVETGTWNIDNLLDGIKEGRIKLTEFGAGIDKTTASLLEGTSISSQKLQEWGKAVSAGGEGGTKAMQEVAQALAGVDDKTKQNQLGVAIFGTLWEDQGTNISSTLLGMNDNLTTAEENQNNLNSATESLNSDPMIQLKAAISDLQTALAPLLLKITEAVTWFLNLDDGTKSIILTIGALVVAIGILLIVVGQMSIGIAAMTGAMGGLTIATIANKLETIAIAALYAKDFILSIASGTAALVTQAAQWVINTGLKIADTIATTAMTVATGIWNIACGTGAMLVQAAQFVINTGLKIADTIATTAMTVATTAWTIICGVATVVTTALGIAFAFLTSPIGLVILAIAAVIAIGVLLYKNWDTIKEVAFSVFGAIGDFIGGICDSVGGFFKGMINGVISGLNWMIGALNNLNFTVPDWVPGIGGENIGFDIPEIPSFAVGTKYLPQDMLIQAHKGEMIVPKSENPYANSNGSVLGNGSSGPICITVVSNLDGRQIAEGTAIYNDQIQGKNIKIAERGVGL